MAVVSVGPFVQPSNHISTVLNKWPHTVHMKQTWDADWVYVPYVRALSGKFVALPGKSTVQLVFDYGEIAREGRSTFFDSAKLANYDHFVCLKVLPEGMPGWVLWTGIIPAHAFEVEGTKLNGTIVKTSGKETMTAHGFEYLLERRRIIGGWVYEEGLSPYTAKNIGWAPTFNHRQSRGAALLGNRSAEKIVTDGPTVIPLSYGFATDLDAIGNPFRWSVRDVIEYLLQWSNPLGGVEPTFILEGPDQAPYDLIGYLDELYDVVAPEGRTVWDLLKKLLDRRHGLSALLAPSFDSDGFPDGSKPISLYAFSMTDVPSRVGGFTFPANPFWVDLTIDVGVTLKRAVVRTDSLGTYDKIVVEGERVVSCFSVEIDPLDGRAPIEIAWPAADAVAYKAADKAERERKKDLWERVYRMFRLPDDFDWSGYNAFNPSFDNDGRIDVATVAPFWNVMHRFLGWLPIPVSSSVAAESPVPGMTRPLVFVQKFNEDTGDPTGEWLWIESPPLDDDGKPLFEKGSLTMHNREGLFEVGFNTHHYLARNHLLPDPDDDDAVSPPVFDYERMVATIAVEADSVPRVQVTTQVTGGLTSRTLTIHVPGVQVWVVGTGSTVIGLNADGSLAYYTGSGVARDDTDQLRAVAALARSVYGKRRSAIRLTEEGIWSTAELGTMVRAVTIDQQRTLVNSVVTELSWDFVAGTTTVLTEFLNLDTRRFK